MSTRIDTLVAEAHTAVATLKATTAANRESALAAFVASATATYALVKASPKGGASRLAAVNKEAGVGYTSSAAVGFHAVTGQVLSLPEGEVDPDNPLPSPTAIQALVKKVGQEKSKDILKGARTQAAAVAGFKAADSGPKIEDLVKGARLQVEKAVTAFVTGKRPLTDDERNAVRDLLATIDNLITPDSTVIVPGDASSLEQEADATVAA